MGKLLDEALKNRTKQNQKIKERLEEVKEDAEDFEAEAEEFLEMLTSFDESETEPKTKEILVRGKIKMSVYVDLTGEQEALMGELVTVHRQSKKRGKNNVPDLEKAIDAACKLAASLVVPEDGRPWHKESTWRGILKLRNTDDLMETLGELLEPYQDKCKKQASFR